MLKRYTKRYLSSLIWITIFTSIQGQSSSTTSDFRDYRLELFEEEKGYDAAKTVCDGRNAWLVEIKDKETQAAVQQLTKNAIWIGLHHDGEWKWNGIDKLKFTNWVSEHPKAISGQLNNSCVVSRTPDGKWLDRNCQNSYRYVCQSDKSWIIFNNETTLQIISSPQKNFVESQQACANNGSTLVEIKTDALDIFINQKLSGNTIFWTSGNDKKEEGIWKWGDGTAIDIKDKNWKIWDVKNEPDGYRGQNCLAKHPSAGFKWIDFKCNHNAGYICQRNISSGDCGRDVCSDKGTCQVNGNRYKCTCEAGYFGTKCEKELILISTPTTLYEIKRGRNLTAIFNITSYDGNFNISVSTTGNHEVTSKSTTGITSNTVSSTLMFTLGPFETARNLTYNFTANRIFYKSYPKVVSIMVVITDECDSMPCMNGGSCVYSVTVPYYNCTCQPAYIGNNCGERRFINNTANNCQYHVNRYDIKSFAEANLTCSSLGGALAMMKTTEIQDWVESQIITQYEATGPTILFWIGGYIVNDSWIWVDGTAVPTTGKDSKWAFRYDNITTTSEMVLSSWPNRARNIMRWFAKRNNANPGYICEISAIDRCSPSPCLNSGACIQIGCQRKCKCMWGFTGENCETRISQISCLQSGISIQWNQEKHKFGNVYKLHLEDLMSKTSKVTNVQILLTNEPSITIGNVSEPTPIHCVSSTRLSISSNKYILVDLWVARIRMSLKSVAKVYHIFDESQFKLEFVDLA